MVRQHSPTDDLQDLRAVFSADHDLSAPERSVMAILILHRNGESGRCDPGLGTIAKASGLGRRTVMRSLNVLEEGGWVERHQRPLPQTTSYILHARDRATVTLGPERHEGQSGTGVEPESHHGRATVAPERTEERTDERADDIQDVFDYWKNVSGHATARLLEGRRRKIRARLKVYTVRELKTAISAGCGDPFFQGENDRGKRYDWIETLLKSDEAVERHLESADSNGSDPLLMTSEEAAWER